jgi:predicted transcriptional regulator of viral defense system
MKTYKFRGLSPKEVEVVSWLEFYQKYFFTSKDIAHFYKNKNVFYRGIQKLLAKKRIIKLNRNKYYLITMKAKSGSWGEHEFIIVDEILNSEEYYIGGWSAANYWHLSDQVPSWVEVFSKKRQGKKEVLNTRIIFHRIRKIDKSMYVIKKIKKHEFKILNKKETRKWMKSRE